MKKIFVVFWSMMLTMSVIFAQSIGFYQGDGKIGQPSEKVATPGDSVYAQKQREKNVAQNEVKFFTVPLGISHNELIEMRKDSEKFCEVEYPVKDDHSLEQYTANCKQQNVSYQKVYSFMDDEFYAAGVIMPYNTEKEKEVVGYMMTSFRERSMVPVGKIIAYDDEPKVISRSNDTEQYLMATATWDDYQMNIIFTVSKEMDLFDLYMGSGDHTSITVTMQLSKLSKMNEAKLRQEKAVKNAENKIIRDTDW